jgi:hypothetical protein
MQSELAGDFQYVAIKLAPELEDLQFSPSEPFDRGLGLVRCRRGFHS